MILPFRVPDPTWAATGPMAIRAIKMRAIGRNMNRLLQVIGYRRWNTTGCKYKARATECEKALILLRVRSGTN